MHRLLDEVTQAPFTLVVAPAGAGKSSLLAGWTAESSARTCWLTVDESDQDVAQLWSTIIEALEGEAAGCGTEARQLLRRPETVMAALDELIEGLDLRLSSPTVLVLDDFHFVDRDEFVVLSLAYFVQHAPRLLRVVLASRRIPKLPIDRMRARGLIGEVHFAELRFSPAEAAEMLAHLAPTMAEDDMLATASRAEGWAAGVQLAALAARANRAAEVPEAPQIAADSLIHDYVWHEVLNREDVELVRVLSDISVVGWVNPGLAQALTRRPDVVEQLEQAEARGLFVSHRGSEGWFEVHALVRAALVQQLASTNPGRLTDLHVRAARWFEAANEVALSLEHWLLAGEPRSALRLLADRTASLYDAGMEATIGRYVAAIPADVAALDTEAMVEFAWCHLLVNRRRFVELVDQTAFWAQRDKLDTFLRGRVSFLQSAAATTSGRFAEGGRFAARALEEFGDAWWQDSLGRFVWNGVARANALNESWSDATAELRQAEVSLGRDPPRRVAFEGSRALGHALAGRPVDALRVSAGIRDAVAVDNRTILHGELVIAEGVAHREIGDRARALAQLEALAETPAETMLYCRILAILELIQAHLDEDDLGSSQRLFAQAETMVEEESLGADVRVRLARVGTRLSLAAGDLEAAKRWSGRVDDRFWAAACAARVHLAVSDRAGAAAALDTAIPRCPRHELVLALLRARCAYDHEEALKSVAVAVENATANGLLQSVVSEGPDLTELLEQSAWRAPQSWMDRLRRAAIGGSPPVSETLYEPLTERERDVLRFLPSRLTLGEIAKELYISVNTLKFHLKVIYRKLGVNSRVEAAEVSRQMTGRGHHSA